MRIVGIAGDTIAIRDDRLIVNGNPVDTLTDEPCETLGQQCAILRETLNGKTYGVLLMKNDKRFVPTGPNFFINGFC